MVTERMIREYKRIDYNREKDNQPHFWDDHKAERWKKIQIESNKRYYYILKEFTKKQVDPLFLTHVKDYGIGNTRSLKDWFNFTGINMKNHTVEDHCSKKYNKITKKWE